MYPDIVVKQGIHSIPSPFLDAGFFFLSKGAIFSLIFFLLSFLSIKGLSKRLNFNLFDTFSTLGYEGKWHTRSELFGWQGRISIFVSRLKNY